MGEVTEQQSEGSLGDGQGPSDVEADTTLSTSDVFDILKNERRRAVIQFLHDHGSEASLSDVSEHIAAAENDTDVRHLSSQERKRVRIALYQCHLPRMDRLGIVDFDKDRGTIEFRPPASQVQRYLGVESRDDVGAGRADRSAFVLVVGVAALVTAGTIGVGPLSVVPPVGWTAVSVLALLAVAGQQYRHG